MDAPSIEASFAKEANFAELRIERALHQVLLRCEQDFIHGPIRSSERRFASCHSVTKNRQSWPCHFVGQPWQKMCGFAKNLSERIAVVRSSILLLTIG